MMYLGDFPTGATVRLMFSTNAATGARTDPSSAWEAADVRVYKNNGTTQRASEAGYTVTSTFDSMTGITVVSIDLSDNTDAGFYAAGNEYTIVLYPDETVDSVAVAAVLAHFSIERSGGALAILKDATYGLSALETLVDGIEAKTNNLPASPAATGDAMTLADGAITAAKVATGAIDADALAADAANEIADALLDRAAGVETGYTLRQALRIVLAACAGKLSGAATTTVAIRDVGDSKARITATVDADGNRTAVTLDAS